MTVCRGSVFFERCPRQIESQALSGADPDAGDFTILIPLDPRLARICEAVLADTSSDLTLDDWADRSGLSRRTLTRLFRRETGQSFSAWRQRVRLLESRARLGAGESVTSVALDVGYDSPSAFTAMFRRELGAAPRRYLRWADQEIVLR